MRLKWDSYSDQPEVIKDKAFKRKIKKEARWASLKMLLINIFIYPISYAFYLLSSSFSNPKKTEIKLQNFFGMSINLDKNPDEARQFIDDLQVNTLLIRLPLSDIENIQAYITFAEEYKDKEILINILQDRRHVEDHQLLKQSIDEIFQKFSHLTDTFQIGNAINRKKWAFFSMDEYLSFYKVAYDLKKEKYHDVVLLGSSVIDFEYYFSIRTLFNFYKIYYDQFSTLLYVDRRGAPENTQMGLDLIKKIRFLQAILRLSPKSNTDIVITETNWPIEKSAPYAPTGEKECVSHEDHADFLVRYYLLALTTGAVTKVYWHQLVAPGYGLIDNRGEQLIKYPAYHAFKNMLAVLQDASFVGFKVEGDIYKVSLSKVDQEIDVLWSVASLPSSPSSLQRIDVSGKQALSRNGDEIDTQNVLITQSPIYLISNLSSLK